MPLSQEAIQAILGIKKKVDICPEKMAKNLNVTFFKGHGASNDTVVNFSEKLKKTLTSLGVNIIPYENTLVSVPLFKKIKTVIKLFLYSIFPIPNKLRNKNYTPPKKALLNLIRGKKVKKGIAIIAVGEGKTGNLPMDNTMSFRENPVITIVEKPKEITASSNFNEHMETALKLFAWNMSNLIISVSKNEWVVYTFNGSYPTHQLDKNFKRDVLNSLVPKIAAPVQPPRLKNFVIKKGDFNINNKTYSLFTKDLMESGRILEKTGLYPPRKSIDELKFRKDYYRWIGSIHLDKRNGMSYGFLSRQLPTKLVELIPEEKATKKLGFRVTKDKDYFISKDKIYILINVLKNKFVLPVPEVWVLATRSGSDKTALQPKNDIIKMGLVNGKMVLKTPKGVDLDKDYRPSFDTKIILSHAVANAIFASVIAHINPQAYFPKILQNNGVALAHWHGYLKPEYTPKGYQVYGQNNPSVSCSSPQAAIYAFKGKEEAITKNLINDIEFKGDIHVEPHHGTNMTFESLVGLANFLLKRYHKA